jgi:hypothetical protein
MDAGKESDRTKVERKSERELVVTRTFNGPARIVFEAWTKGAAKPASGCARRTRSGASRDKPE